MLALTLLYWTSVETEQSLNISKIKPVMNSTKSNKNLDKSSVRVFLVEDEPTTIILTEAMLNQLGYSPVGVATSFETAMAALKVTSVDIVLVDLVLAGTKTGFDVIKELNRLNIPCVLITGTINETTLNKLLDLDVYGFLPKPYDQLALATSIQLALRKFARMQDRIFEEADAIKSRLLATQALEQEFGLSEKMYLVRKDSTQKPKVQTSEAFSYHQGIHWILGITLFFVGMALSGFIFDIPFLLMFSNHAAAIKLNTLVCVILFCFSLGVENSYRTGKKWKIASAISLTAILGLSGLTLLQYIFSVNFGIDEFLGRDRFSNEYSVPGRMAIPTTVGLILLCFSLISNRFKNYKYGLQLTEGFAFITFYLAVVGVFGHLFKQIEFNRVVPYLAQSRVTLVILILLSLGVFYLNPRKGLMWIFSNKRLSAKVGKKMLFLTNGLMILISLAIHYLLPDSRFDKLEVIFLLIASISALTLIILWATQKQIRNEAQVEQTIKLLENRERELQFVLKRVPHAIAVLDKDLHYVLVSRQWTDEFGLRDKNSLGLSLHETFPLQSDYHRILFQRAMRGEIVKFSELEIDDLAGRNFSVKGEIRPWFNITDQIAGIIVFFESVNVLRPNQAQ